MLKNFNLFARKIFKKEILLSYKLVIQPNRLLLRPIEARFDFRGVRNHSFLYLAIPKSKKVVHPKHVPNNLLMYRWTGKECLEIARKYKSLDVQLERILHRALDINLRDSGLHRK